MSLAVLVLVGWYAQLPQLTHVVPGWATMKANTAVCFLLCGLVLLRASYRHGKVHTDKVSAVLLAGVALIALTSLVEYGIGRNLGLDELLIRDVESRHLGQPPGRMSPATSVSLFCLSIGLLLIDYSGVSCLLCLAGMALSFLALVGFLYRVDALYRVRPFATVALHTAFGFAALGLGTLTLRRRQGVGPLLLSSYAEMAGTRPSLAGALLLPPGFGLLCLAGERRGWYPAEFTLSIMTVLLMLASCLLVWWTSRTGMQIDHRRRAAERDLHAQTEELTRSNAALEQYAFAAAHDLQEPLRMISIFTQKLSRAPRERISLEEHESLQIVRSSAERMIQLVTDLLLHSRILTQSDRNFSMVDMNAVLHEVLGQASMRIADTGAQIIVGNLPSVTGDFGQLVHLFQNLVENALKYCKPDIVPQVQISARIDGANWVFAVMDNGIGLDMKYARQIFGLFKRLHGREIPGTGIGLAISERVVERHSGRIWVESQPGVGSTFRVAFARERDSIDKEQSHSDPLP